MTSKEWNKKNIFADWKNNVSPSFYAKFENVFKLHCIYTVKHGSNELGYNKLGYDKIGYNEMDLYELGYNQIGYNDLS